MQARFCFAVAAFLAITWAMVTNTTAQEASKSDSPEIKVLLKERCDVLAKRIEFVRAMYEGGRGDLNSLFTAMDQLLLAKLELADSKEQRVTLTRERLDNLRELEKVVKQRFEAGTCSTEEMLSATAARLQAEIDLLREQQR